MKSLIALTMTTLSSVLLLLPTLSFAIEWHWDTSNNFLNPSQVNLVPPSSPFLYDIDSDGDKDMIVGQGNGTILLLYNDGFPDNVVWRTDTTYFGSLHFDNMVVPTYGDIDGDDSLELVVSFQYEQGEPYDSLSLYRNIGTNTDPIWSERFGLLQLDPNYGHFFTNQKILDFNGDGVNDIAAMHENASIEFFKNIGTPNEPIWVVDEAWNGENDAFRYACGITGFDIADFNGDGAYDVILTYIICDDGTATAIWFNRNTNESPDFSGGPEVYVSFGTGYNDFISVVDLDRDGSLDLVTGGSYPLLTYNHNNGSISEPDFDGIGDISLGPFFHQNAYDFTLLDKDLDGALDLILAFGFTLGWPDFEHFLSNVAYKNFGDSRIPDFRQVYWIPGYIYTYYTDEGLTAGDLNGDGWPDYAMSLRGVLSAQINDPDSTFNGNAAYFYGINSTGSFKHPEIVDIDNDGIQDIFAKDDSLHVVTAFRNAGTPQNPTWQRRDDWANGLPPNTSVIRAGDFNEDGLQDLALKVDGHLQGFLNIGNPQNPQFAYDRTMLQDLQNISLDFFDAADLDGDGKSDIIANSAGSFVFYDNESITAIDDLPPLPESNFISNCYPNPFNNSTNIKFSLSKSSHVKIEVFDITGAHVASIYDGILNAGENIIRWDSNDNSGSNVASGVYFYRLSADNKSETRKMVLLK